MKARDELKDTEWKSESEKSWVDRREKEKVRLKREIH